MSLDFKKLQAAELVAGAALVVKVLEYAGKQISWGDNKTFEPVAAFLSFLSVALLLASVLLWLNSSSKSLAKVDDVALRVGEIKQELDRLETSLAKTSRTNVEQEEIFQFRPEKISGDRMRNVWIALLWRVEKRYWATNYIKDAEIYLKGYADSALAIQAAKIKAQRVDIKKVFIVQDDNERQKMEPIFKAQHAFGIDVRYMLKDMLNGDTSLKAKASKLATNDFGLIDSRITLLWFLTKDRSVDSGKVVLGSEELAAYEDFFNALLDEAKRYPTEAKSSP